MTLAIGNTNLNELYSAILQMPDSNCAHEQSRWVMGRELSNPNSVGSSSRVFTTSAFFCRNLSRADSEGAFTVHGRKTYQLTKMDQDNAGIRSGQMAQETLYIYVHMYIYIYMYDKDKKDPKSQEPGNGQ